MSPKAASLPGIEVYPVTHERWLDFERLFGRRGACGGCWCMHWRLSRPEFEKKKGPGNKRAMKKIIESGAVPGLLAYADDEPIAWCALGPREVYPRLEGSRVCKRVDDQPVWSVVCFFVAKPYRGMGVTVKLLKAAVAYATERGARIVEGYPVDPRGSRYVDTFAYTGLSAAFTRAGFVEVARRSAKRPLMRRAVRRAKPRP